MIQNEDISGSLSKFPDDQFFQGEINAAEAGNLDAAWVLLHYIIEALDRRHVSPVLFDYAASFFERIFEIKGERTFQEMSRKELAKALDLLHLSKPRGRPKLSDDEAIARLSLEEHMRESGKSATNARSGIAERGIAAEATMQELRTKRPDLVHIVSLCSEQEKLELSKLSDIDVQTDKK